MKNSKFGLTALEATIVSLADGYLKEMEHNQNHLQADELSTCFLKLTALVELAHLAESGLSEMATKSLLDIDQKATRLVSSFGETNKHG